MSEILNPEKNKFLLVLLVYYTPLELLTLTCLEPCP